MLGHFLGRTEGADDSFRGKSGCYHLSTTRYFQKAWFVVRQNNQTIPNESYHFSAAERTLPCSNDIFLTVWSHIFLVFQVLYGIIYSLENQNDTVHLIFLVSVHRAFLLLLRLPLIPSGVERKTNCATTLWRSPLTSQLPPSFNTYVYKISAGCLVLSTNPLTSFDSPRRKSRRHF